MKKSYCYKLMFIVAIICIFLLAIFYFTSYRFQKVGFPNDNIYYNMSINSFKREMGEFQNEITKESGAKCYTYDVTFNGIKGKCSFDFVKDKLSDITFISISNGYDKSIMTEIIEYIETFYKNKKGFEIENDDNKDNYYSFCVKDNNGATGKFVTIELKYNGTIVIMAENTF